MRWERTVQMNAVPQFMGFTFTSHWRAAPAVQRHLWLVTLAEKDFKSKVEKLFDYFGYCVYYIDGGEAITLSFRAT
jgi:hypothetical protein